MSTDRIAELLTQLKAKSPMPDDDSLTKEQIEEYGAIADELEQVLAKNEDPRVIEPLINSFGYGDGYGTYWTPHRLLLKFDKVQLRPYLLDAVQHGERGVRQWAAYTLGVLEDKEAVPYLIALLNDPEDNVRLDAVQALAMIADPTTRPAIERLESDPSEEVRDVARDVLAEF